jgi:hypothetical protein
MSRRLLCAGVCVSLLALHGCDTGPEAGNVGQTNADSSGQPKEAPWVKTTESQFSVSSTSTDPNGNRVFSCTASEFRGLLDDIADEFKTPIVVKPKKMLNWTLTVEVKGTTADEVLNDIATNCKLSLGKSSSGLPMLVFPGDTAGDEVTVQPGNDDGETEE